MLVSAGIIIYFIHKKNICNFELYSGSHDYYEREERDSFYSEENEEFDEFKNYYHSPVNGFCYNYSQVKIFLSPLYKKIVVILPDGIMTIWDLETFRMIKYIIN